LATYAFSPPWLRCQVLALAAHESSRAIYPYELTASRHDFSSASCCPRTRVQLREYLDGIAIMVLGLLNQRSSGFSGRGSLARRREELRTWTYKGYVIIQKCRRKGQRWLSSAKCKTTQDEFSLMAYPPTFEGFYSKNEAHEATARFVRAQLDQKTGARLQLSRARKSVVSRR
jgi:hypothetical protein